MGERTLPWVSAFGLCRLRRLASICELDFSNLLCSLNDMLQTSDLTFCLCAQDYLTEKVIANALF